MLNEPPSVHVGHNCRDSGSKPPCRWVSVTEIYSADKILETDDVAEIKALGRGVSGYDDHYWNGVRQVIVYEGLVAKFSQNEELKKRLLDTGNDMLAECAVKDRIWGIGLSMTDPDRQDMSKWKGQNLLGYALMMVRNKLIKTE